MMDFAKAIRVPLAVVLVGQDIGHVSRIVLSRALGPGLGLSHVTPEQFTAGGKNLPHVDQRALFIDVLGAHLEPHC